MNASSLILVVIFGLPLLVKLSGRNKRFFFIQRILGGSVGPRTDVDNMSRKELLRSGTKFVLFGAGCIIGFAVLAYLLSKSKGIFEILLLILLLPVSFGVLIGCLGGLYLIVRGAFRDREYMVAVPASSREHLNDFQKKICSSLDEAFRPYGSKASIKAGTFRIKKKENKYFWEEYTVDNDKPGSFRLKAEVHHYFLRISMDEWSDDYNVYESGLSSSEFAKNAADMMMEVLSGKVKIEVKSINGKPYRWTRYDLRDGKWIIGPAMESRIHQVIGQKTEEEKFCRNL